MSKTVTNPNKGKKKAVTEEYLAAEGNEGKKKAVTEDYLAAEGNEGLKDFVQGGATGGVNYNPIPESASREEQDIMQIWQSAYSNAASIENNALQAKLNANKAHELATKYLAVQNKANGLGGLGIADTSALRLSSQYQQALSDANAAQSSALQENYAKMNEDVNTVRGEWASQEEAKAQTKLATVESAIMSIDDKTKVEDYLDSMGYDEGTQERADLMATWKLMYDGPNTDEITLPSANDLSKNDEALKALRAWRDVDNPVTIKSEHINTTYVDSATDFVGHKYAIVQGDGFDVNTFAEKAAISGGKGLNAGEAGLFGGEKKRSKAIANAARRGEIVNGTIVDLNVGGGTNPWLYLNKKFYKLTKVS